MKRCVITSGSVISPLGEDWNTIFTKLKAKENAVVYMKEWDIYTKLRSKIAAPSIFTPIDLPRKALRSMGRVALHGVTAAHRALENANLLNNEILSDGECGIAYGSSYGSFESIEEALPKESNGNYFVNGTTYIKTMPQTAAVNIAVVFSVRGRLITTDVACASGNYAIGSAYEIIKNGKQKVMIAGGGDELTYFSNAIFDALLATSMKNDNPKLTPSPFDKNRDGLVVGEGTGVLILEEYEYAKARGANIMAEVVGFAQNSDGRHITQPTKEMMEKVMLLAIEDANISKDDIGYVNAHGTGTRIGDMEEAVATFNVFKRDIPISSQKSYIGHTLAGCGAIEAYMSIHMMNEKWFAPNINLNNIDENLPPLNYITGDGLNLDVEYVMCNNFAFGGINTSLILKKYI